MKKVLSILLAICFIFSLTACGKAPTDATGGTETTSDTFLTTDADSKDAATDRSEGLIAICLPSLDNPLMLGISDAMKNTFAGIAPVEIASADQDANKQVTQIQNYITMGAVMLVVMPVEASTVVEVLKQARQSGIKVVVNGTSMSDSDSYDTMATVNQYLVGCYCSLMAKEWIDQNYPGAAEKSIETAVLTSSQNQDAVDRTNGIVSITEPYLKNASGDYVDASGNIVEESGKVANPAYCPAVKIVSSTDAEMFQAGQTAMQNIMTTNPKVRLVLAYASDGGCGANQAVLDSGASSEELGAYAIFGCGVIGSEGDYIKDADQGKGIFRGAVAFGGGDLPGAMADLANKVFTDGQFEKETWDAIAKVYCKDGEIVRDEVNNVGSVSAE